MRGSLQGRSLYLCFLLCSWTSSRMISCSTCALLLGQRPHSFCKWCMGRQKHCVKGVWLPMTLTTVELRCWSIRLTGRGQPVWQLSITQVSSYLNFTRIRSTTSNKSSSSIRSCAMCHVLVMGLQERFRWSGRTGIPRMGSLCTLCSLPFWWSQSIYSREEGLSCIRHVLSTLSKTRQLFLPCLAKSLKDFKLLISMIGMDLRVGGGCCNGKCVGFKLWQIK